MKKFIKSFLLISTISCGAWAVNTDIMVGCIKEPCIDPGTGQPILAPKPPIAEEDKYDLTCENGAVCLEQGLKQSKHSFHIAPGSVVRVEV